MNFDRSLGKWSLKIVAKSDLQNLCLGDKRFYSLDRSLGKWSLKIVAKSDLQNLCLGDKRFYSLDLPKI